MIPSHKARFDCISYTQDYLDFYHVFFGRIKLIFPSKSWFRAHSILDKLHLLQSWAQIQMQHSTLLQICVLRTMCLVFDSKCVDPISSWQNWRQVVSDYRSQSPQESACTFPVRPLSSNRQSFPPTVSHEQFLYPIQFERYAFSVFVTARIRNQQKLHDKIETRKKFSAGISCAFLQCESWDQLANMLRSWDL